MRSWHYLIASARILTVGFLILGTGGAKGKEVPRDDRHGASYQAFNSDRTRSEVELLCCTCHSKSSLPLLKDHSSKEQCLLCHQMTVS